MKMNSLLTLVICLCSLLGQSCIAFEVLHDDVSPHHVLEKNDEFEFIWELSDIYTGSNERRAAIVSVPGKIIVEGGYTKLNDPSLIAFDSLSGEIVWQVPLGFGHNGYIISQNTVLYRGTAGAAKVQAFAADKGELLWETNLPWAQSALEIYFADKRINVFTANNKFFILDDQGKIIDSRYEPFRTFLEMGGILYIDENIAMKAIDISTKQELWRQEINDRFTHSPIFDNGTVFLRTWVKPGYIYSINQATGKVNWKLSHDVLSNLCVTGNKIYFVDFDGYLVAIDRYSGDETAKVKFSSSFDLANGINGYSITSDPINNVLAISFGDNSQLLGLKIKNP